MQDLNDSHNISHCNQALHDADEIEENVLAGEESCTVMMVMVSDENSDSNDEVETADVLGEVECNL